MARKLCVVLILVALMAVANPAAAVDLGSGWPGPVVLLDPRDGRLLGVAHQGPAISSAAPPGSIAKIVTAYAGLERGLITQDRRIICRGRIGNRLCGKRHGGMTLRTALAQSCNVYFLTLGAEVGARHLLKTARRFGFGRSTGSGLTGEIPGTLIADSGPHAAWDLAYGVGGSFLATPIQIARAMAAVANGGKVLRPHRNRGPAVVEGTLEDRFLAPIRAGLRDAALSGTGMAARRGDPAVAGKTGTAEYRDGRLAYFAGFAPFGAPRVVVVTRGPGLSGAKDAAPAAARALAIWARAQDTGPVVRVRLFAAHSAKILEVAADGGIVSAGGVRERFSGKLVLSPLGGGIGWGRSTRPRSGEPSEFSGAGRASRTTHGGGNFLSEGPVDITGFPLSLRLPGLERRLSGTVRVQRDGKALVAVASLPLEAYVASVIRAEVGAGWPEQALEAQAVAIRTYALRHRGKHAAEGADLCDLTHCQVFHGGRGEIPAAEATRGEVLVYRGQPIEALFHAACGGRRSANEEVFGGEPLAYLRGGADPECTGPDQRWSRRASYAQLTRALAPDLDVGPIGRLAVLRRGPSGVPLEVEVTGSAGRRITSAYQLWRDLGVGLGWGTVKGVHYLAVNQGAGVVFVGRGAGHGVGLCQHGALQMARRGEKAKAILARYYPGAHLEVL